MPRSRAISLLLCPSARWRSISNSRGVSAENRSGRPDSRLPSRHHLREDAGHFRGDDRFSADDGGQRVDELVGLHVLEEVAARARAQRRDEIALVAARGEHHHRAVEPERRQPLQHGQAVELRHAEIEEHHVGGELGGEPAPLLAVADRRAHLDAPAFQELAQAAPEQRVIVDDQHAERFAVSGHESRPPTRRRSSERPGSRASPPPARSR